MKRLIGLIFSVFAALLIVTGCSSDTETDSIDQKDPGNQKIDVGNQKSEPESKPTIKVGIYDRGLVPASEGTLENNRWTKWINENGPVNVEFVPIPRWESIQTFNTLFASGNAPDFFMEYDTNYRNQLYAQKQLLPLDDLIENHSTEYKKILEQEPLLDKLGRKPDGKLYEVGQVIPPGVNFVYYVRVDWLEKLDLEIPRTTEELYEVAKVFTEQDPDGNGKDDTFGISLSFRSGEMLDHMFQNVTWVLENDQLIRDWDRVKAATEFKKRLYDEGLVDRDYLVDTNGTKAEQDWVNGKLGIWGANNGVSGLGYGVYQTLMKNDPDAKILPIELPASAFGQFSSYINPPARTLGMINATTKHPEAVMKFIDFMVSEEFVTTLTYGFEGIHHTIDENGCPKLIEEKKEEVSYLQDFRMIFSSHLYHGDCGEFINQLNPDSPIDKQFIEFIDIAEKAYISKDRPYPSYTHHSAFPSVPDDIALIETNTRDTINDYWVRAIVSGDSYTVENALNDAKNTWEKAGGQKAEDWYKQWYEENKDTAFLTPDMYE